MRKLLNTLYVTTPEAYLTKDGENVVIRVKEKDIQNSGFKYRRYCHIRIYRCFSGINEDVC